MEGDSLIRDKRSDHVLIRLAQLIAAEGIGCFLEMGTRYVTICECDIPLRAHLPYLSGASLKEGILAPAGLKDGDSGLGVTEQVDELAREVRSPQLDGLCGIESFEMADEWFVSKYPGWEGGMVGSACCDGSTAGHVGVNVQVYRVSVVLVDEECAIGCGEEMIKPGKILAELRGEGERALFRALPEGIQHPVEEQAGWRRHLGYIEQLAEKGAKLPESGRRLADSMTHQELNLSQLVLGE